MAFLLAVPAAVGVLPGRSAPAAAAPPAGFTEQVVFSGLTNPTNLAFSPDGRVFVAQKNGIVKVYDNLSDPTPTTFADLRPQVYDYEDLGLIGLALPPNFPADPYVYVSYTYDGVIGGTAPTYNDACPVIGNCKSSSRVSRLQANGNVMTGTEQVLLHDWCHQIESHSIGDLGFGPDGALYVTGGEGASGSFVDYGQAGSPTNPCGDPPAPVGGSMTPPTAEGGALRSQDIRTTGDPTGLAGTLIRIDPVTAAAMPDNPLAGDADANARRIVAYGLRNPFRWAFRPGTSEIWVGDVGFRTWEEINRIPDPAAGPVRNYGWPCYEGNNPQSGFNSANLTLCESLYTAPAGTVTAPYFTYSHAQNVVAGDGCPTGGSSPSGVAFYPASGGNYPATYAGAMFFADYARGCIFAMRAGAGGVPDSSAIVPFTTTASGPVDRADGPDNQLYYVDLTGGTVRRFHYESGNRTPTANLTATPTSGSAPLAVSFDAGGSTDPDGDTLTYQWDFTGDGSWDATGVTASHTYPDPGTYTAKLQVTDSGGLSATRTTQILAGTNAPIPVIDAPSTDLRWSVGETVTFSGHATDPQDGNLPASALSWQLINRHCDTTGSCHTHIVLSSSGVASGSFIAPDHEFPSHLELTLTATDSGGLTGSTTLRLDPRTVDLTLTTNPSGLRLNLNGATLTTPSTVPVIVGSTNTLSAPSPQSAGSNTFTFTNWSDGGAQTHVLTAPATATTYTATYAGSGGCADTYGYSCQTLTAQPFLAADATVLPLTGDDAVTRVDLPFPVPFYGQTYDQAWIDVNGKLSFLDPGASWGVNTGLPDAAAPNAAVYPFWDDLVVRSDSTIRTATMGTAPNRSFVVEWRNIGMYGSSSARVTFEAVLAENGVVTFNYADLSTAGRELGDSATVGIENANGTVALPYSYNLAALANGRAIVFTPPGSPPPSTGTVSGTVTDALSGTPVSGATVSLSPGGLTTSTGTDGGYTLTNVPAGSYTVNGTADGGRTGSAAVTVTGGAVSTVNLTLKATASGPAGYDVTVESRAFVPAGDTVLPMTGDEAVSQVSLPFSFPFHGANYGTAWVSSNGFLSFADPSGAQPINAPVPDAAAPNAAVYPFWDDLVIRDDSTIRTGTLGSGADQRFVVEWRNIGLYGVSSARITVSAVLSANGEIAFHYLDLASTKPRERGDSATVGVENATGTAAVQHSYNTGVLTDGQAVVFRPR
ncbi:MAG TPA: PQQ-dependent sugar dehydrogenase [Micromonospora sp.]